VLHSHWQVVGKDGKENRKEKIKGQESFKEAIEAIIETKRIGWVDFYFFKLWA
jgi:hypothetical protein